MKGVLVNCTRLSQWKGKAPRGTHVMSCDFCEIAIIVTPETLLLAGAATMACDSCAMVVIAASEVNNNPVKVVRLPGSGRENSTMGKALAAGECEPDPSGDFLATPELTWRELLELRKREP